MTTLGRLIMVNYAQYINHDTKLRACKQAKLKATVFIGLVVALMWTPFLFRPQSWIAMTVWLLTCGLSATLLFRELNTFWRNLPIASRYLFQGKRTYYSAVGEWAIENFPDAESMYDELGHEHIYEIGHKFEKEYQAHRKTLPLYKRIRF